MSCSKWLFQYPNDILVETGSGGGGGIQYALRYGFKHIHSIEIDESKHKYCINLFKNNTNVHLYLGDSIEVLPNILEKINGKATFLLDAHIMELKEVHGKVICPILQELNMIINHSKKIAVKHSILVDDAKYFNGKTQSFGNITIDDIRKAVLDVDSSYTVAVNGRMVVVK